MIRVNHQLAYELWQLKSNLVINYDHSHTLLLLLMEVGC